MTDTVLTSTDAGILRITFNRPDKKNALTGEMYDMLDRALAAAALDPAVRVVLIEGSGGSFTSGNDLSDFATWGQSGAFLDLPVIRAIRQIVAFPKPLVAAVQGAAIGFGTTLLPHCDAVIAADSAVFSLPFVKLGLVPEFGSTLTLPLLAGSVRASHKLLTGEAFGRDEALAMGLVSEACDDFSLEATALGVCRTLAALPPATMRQVKALIRSDAQRVLLDQVIDEEARLFAAALSSHEHHEAVSAFLARRAPDFSRFG